MTPITIEFTVRNGDDSFKEDSVTFATLEDMFTYIAPGGVARACLPTWARFA